ncbi:hypothetical protein ABN034_08350 [Actinopolymorpha sp. B11F2]|uniref:hypothetical protein n=1 Tax=Actinopolymorpha sp. B11F2 TaxID=3160862 RepID=UPI0032E440E2
MLHADDAVANKLCALYGRGAVRDYIDVDGIVRSGRYTVADLLQLATQHDPGFDPALFAQALRAVRRFAASAVEPYGMAPEEFAALTERVVGYTDQVRDSRPA